MDIGKIDKNLAVEASVGETDVVYYNAKEEPFEGYGFYGYRTEPNYKRLPDEVGLQVNSGVAALYRNTAGGRIRFATDSPYVAIRAKMSGIARMPHMPVCSSAGFDLYTDNEEDGTSRFYGIFEPKIDIKDGYESKVTFPSVKKRYLTLEFPSYSNVDFLEIGLKSGSRLEKGLSYRPIAPIVYYGSSITQGGCSSRPGTAYQNIICRRNQIDFLNLGFSGSGRGEELIARYMAGLEMSVFVSDYDHNSPAADLAMTHSRLYRIIREAHPDLPYVIISKPDFQKTSFGADQLRRNDCYTTYIEALKAGDRNVYFIDGESLFSTVDGDCCTVDSTHPNDYGFMLMANRIEAELKWIRDSKNQF